MLFRVFRDTRGYTTSNLITTEGLMTWSSEVFRIFSSHLVKWKSYKNRKLKEVLCVVFRSLKKTRKKCVYFVQTVCNFFSCTPSHTQLTNHHTTIIQSYHFQTIIPKSYQNQSNLETYVSKIVWFSCDFGMMVWKWID